MKNQTTKTEKELRGKIEYIIKAAYAGTPYEYGTDEVMQLIQNEREKILKRVDKEVIGDEDLLRNKKDMLPNQYHRAKGRNELRAEERKKLAALASERKLKE